MIFLNLPLLLQFFLLLLLLWLLSCTKSSKTVLLHLGHLGSSSNSMTYIRHLGHPTNTIGLDSGLLIDMSDDKHELGGDIEDDRVGDSILEVAPIVELGGDKFNFKSNFGMLLLPCLLLMVSSLVIWSSKLLFCLL